MMHNYLKKLLNGQTVAWEPLGEVCEIKKGKQLNKTELKEKGIYPAYNGGKSHSGWSDDYNVEANTIIISQGGASAGFVNFITVPFWANAHCYYCLPNVDFLNNRFLYHLLKNQENNLMESQHGAGIPALSQGKVEKLPIPIPPLSVQTEIVRILDEYTKAIEQLKVELQKELNLRQKQYQYYRDKLLSEHELSKVGFEWKTLKEISLEFGRGKSKHRPRNDEQLYGGTIPFIQTGDIRNSAKYITTYQQTYSDFGLSQSKLWKKDALCITIAANIAETAILDFDACFPDSIIGFVADPKQANVSYIYYLLQSLKTKLQSYSTGSAQENINMATFENLLFPIPPLSEQARIVEILDKFDTLTQSITDGLPKEIELRQKQYDYYRQVLLGFE